VPHPGRSKIGSDQDGATRQWFQENYLPRDKETTLVDFSDHYDKKKNKCFILVERHYNSNLAGPNGNSWTNHMSLYAVYENSEYGEFCGESLPVLQAEI